MISVWYVLKSACRGTNLLEVHWQAKKLTSSLPIHHGVGSWMELTAPCFTSHWCDTLWVAHFAFTSNFFRCCNMACSRILTVAGSDEPTSAPAEAVLELQKCDAIEHIEIPCSCRSSGCWWPYSVGHWPTWTRTWLQISGQGGNVTEGTEQWSQELIAAL